MLRRSQLSAAIASKLLQYGKPQPDVKTVDISIEVDKEQMYKYQDIGKVLLDNDELFAEVQELSPHQLFTETGLKIGLTNHLLGHGH